MKEIKGFDIRELNVRQGSEINQKRIVNGTHKQFTLPKSKAKELKRIAFELDTSLSEIIGCAIKQFVEQFNQDNVERLIFKKDDKGLD